VASALATWPAIAPAVNSGPASPAIADHAIDGPVRKFESAALIEPNEPVSESCG
jgi:hypothetical protein